MGSALVEHSHCHVITVSSILGKFGNASSCSCLFCIMHHAILDATPCWTTEICVSCRLTRSDLISSGRLALRSTVSLFCWQSQRRPHTLQHTQSDCFCVLQHSVASHISQYYRSRGGPKSARYRYYSQGAGGHVSDFITRVREVVSFIGSLELHKLKQTFIGLFTAFNYNRIKHDLPRSSP